jgi:hypothetical protein
MNNPATASDLKQSIDQYVEVLEEKHRMHRKIRFLLDIRGLLIINKIEGDYVEFGVYRGEMMYAAAQILSPHITRYIGLDTFEGLPAPQENDADLFVFESPGFMASPKETAEAMMHGYPSILIQGDFRQEHVLEQFRAQVPQISVLTIDCNWPSSVRAALMAGAPYLQAGSIVFVDDYFVATRRANFNDQIMRQVSETHEIRFVEFQTYPPCARAFIVEPMSEKREKSP